MSHDTNSPDEALHVDRLAAGGDGVGRIDGKVVFVPGGLPGERLLIRRRERKRRFDRAELLEVLEPCSARRDLDCRHEIENGCGGCGFRHVADEHSLRLKLEATWGEMVKLSPEVAWPEPTRHDETDLDGSRERVRFQLAEGVFGLFRKGTHEPIAVPNCLAAHPEILEGAEALSEAIDGVSSTALPKTVQIERTETGLYAFWPARLTANIERKLWQLVDQGIHKGRGIFKAIRCRWKHGEIALGDPWMTEQIRVASRELHTIRLVGTFGQANAGANRSIRLALHTALAQIEPECLLDLYAGSGNFTLVAALSAKRVVAVEVDAAALDGLTRSAQQNGLANIEVRRRDLRRGLNAAIKQTHADAVVLDPPRTGAREIVGDLIALAPRDIFYVSCSPTHLARDARVLSERYTVKSLEAFDMFPRTPHLELLAHFRRDPQGDATQSVDR